jgi:hypothetical protein
MISWFIHHPAVLFYLSSDESLERTPQQRLPYLWIGLIGIGFLWGLASVGLWHGGQWLFGQPKNLFLLPNLLVAGGVMLVMYRRAATALIHALAGRDAAGVSLTAGFLMLVFWVGFVTLPPNRHVQEQILPNWLAWIRPESKLDRLLLLMPLWGAWSMLILPQFRRPAGGVLGAVARGCGSLTAAAIMGALLAATIGYFAYLPWTQLTIPAVVILAAVGGGLALAKRNGGLDRSVLLATNLLTQLALLLAVAVNSNVR